MDLIFGGAYQGKLDYVKEKYKIDDNEVYTCPREEDCQTPEECLETMNLSTVFKRNKVLQGDNAGISNNKVKVINCLENFVLASTRNGIEAKEYLCKHREELNDTIIIVTDISSGIVPVDRELREWREMVGRTMLYLAKEADTVTRIFCGLPQEIKGNGHGYNSENQY